MKKILTIVLMLLMVSCMSARKPCPHLKNVPKGHECDEFLL